MIKLTSLDIAANELKQNAALKEFDPMKGEAPDATFWRDFQHEDHWYRVCFNKLKTPPMMEDANKIMFLLSVYRVPEGDVSVTDAIINKTGSFLPTPEQGAEIAKAFFPKGCQELGSGQGLGISRKYLGITNPNNN